MDVNLLAVVIILLAFAANYFFTGWFINYAKRINLTDIPIDRSSHNIPTPRGGGIGFMVVSLLSLSAYTILSNYEYSAQVGALILALVIIAIMGWFDDKQNLKKRIRFSIQIICSLIILTFISSLDVFYIPAIAEVEVGYAGLILGLLWIAGTTNIYNFMDGVDGIASIQGIVAAIMWILFGLYITEEIIVFANLIVFVTVLSFIKYNWKPAKIFMGDVGSVFLGFWFASMPFLSVFISSKISISVTIWFGAFVLWPFLFDGSYTIFRRYMNGENVLDAHRSHLYQRLNVLGWSHNQVALLYGLFAVFSSGLAIVFLFVSDPYRLSIIISLIILSVLFARFVRRKEKLRNIS